MRDPLSASLSAPKSHLTPWRTRLILVGVALLALALAAITARPKQIARAASYELDVEILVEQEVTNEHEEPTTPPSDPL
jgi:hypothetical protein